MSRHWMPLYVADYLADTRRLSTLEHGAYMLLIMDYWRNGGLPDDDRKLARIVGLSEQDWSEIRDNIAELFQAGWKHKRIDAELSAANDKAEKAQAAASKRWKSKSDADAMPTHSERICSDDADGMPSQSQSYNTHTQAREPSDGQRYADAVRGVYDLARQSCPDLSPLVAWRKAGWPVEIVCEVIRAKLAANPTKNFTLRYFENAVADAVARANAPVPIGSANQRAGPSAPREKPMSPSAVILQNARQKASHERYNLESQPVVIDAAPLAIGPR